MTPVKLNVFFAFFPYAGNGGTSAEHPSIRTWFANTLAKVKADPRVGEVSLKDFSDTPITMTRNEAVLVGRERKADVIVMTDSDQHPDRHLGDPGAKPFWDSSFDFLYNHYQKGPVLVAAPYCGPPPLENVYLFHWANWETDTPNYDIRLEQFSREQAAIKSGIEAIGAIPTGLSMWDMRCFDVIEPSHLSKREVLQKLVSREMSIDEAERALCEGFFYYEWKNMYAAQKVSTEDVTASRDLSLVGYEKLGYNPVHCNWDAWAGHYKPKCVEKPKPLTISEVNGKYRAAVQANKPIGEKMTYVRQTPEGEAVLAALKNSNGRLKLTQEHTV